MVAIDTEASWTKTRSIGPLGVHAYVAHPDTDHFMCSIYDGDSGLCYVGPPEDAPWDQIRGQEVCAHNYSYDAAVLREYERRGIIPFPLGERGFCTSNLAAYLQCPRSLLDSARELLGVKLDKTTRDKFKGKDYRTLPADVQEEIAKYALGDAKACWLLWKQYAHLMPPHEAQLSAHTTLMGNRGIAVDEAAVQRGIDHYKTLLWEIEKDIPWAQDHPVTSPIQLKAACRAAGIPVPDSTAVKDEDFQVWAEQYSASVPFVAAVQRYRSVNRSLKVLEAMQVRTFEGRVRYGLKYFGANHTGRWSGDSGLNCVTGNHEVLTRNGWVRIDLWDAKTTEIAQWSPSGDIEFVLGEKISRLYSGRIIDVDDCNISLRATADHRVPCYDRKGQMRVKTAHTFSVSRTAVPTAGRLANPVEGEINSDNRVRLMVALAADGSDTRKRGKLNGSVSFGFRKHRKILRLREMLVAEGIPFSEKVYRSKGNETTRFYVAVADRPAWWQKGFGPWLLTLTSSQIDCLLAELPVWDGFYNHKSGAIQFTTVLRSEAEWVKTAAHLGGRCASLNEYPRAVSTGFIYHVYIKATSIKGVAPGRGHTKITEGTVHDLEVFCPQVPSSFWLVRHRDRIHVTGNCQNLPRDPVEGVNIRKCLKAGPGKKLVVADYSQIEARVNLWLARDLEQLELVRGGMCVYEAYARKVLGYSDPRSLKAAAKDDPQMFNLRQYAKSAVLGLGYGLGKDRFRSYAKTVANLDITDAESAATVQQFRNSSPALMALWKRLSLGLAIASREKGRTFHMELPSGRTISYWGVTPTKDGVFVQRERGGHKTNSYAGKLMENLTQATARELFALAILRIEAAGYPVVMHVHDEIVCEVPEVTADLALLDIERLMIQSPAWAGGLPVGVEASLCDLYEK